MNGTKVHYAHFFVLLLILGTGAVSFFLATGSTDIQLFIGIMTCLAYIIWGLLHHAIQQDLHPKVVIEYVLIGVIAIVLLMLLLGV